MARYIKAGFLFFAIVVLFAEVNSADSDCGADEEAKQVVFIKGLGNLKVKLGGLGDALGIVTQKVESLAQDLGRDEGLNQLLQLDELAIKNLLQKGLDIFHAFASNELIPELKNVVFKTIDYVNHLMAKEKPNELKALNDFIQEAAQRANDIFGGHN